MRTIALASLALAGTMVAAFDAAAFLKARVYADPQPTYKYTNASIAYNEALSCESCIRGGYDFCIWRTFPTDLIHDQFTNCSSNPVVPELNSETTVNETTRWVCSGNFKDQVNSIINMCYPAAPERRDEALCGEYDIQLKAGTFNSTRSISEMKLNQSCTYRLKTTCGYPALIYSSGSDINNEFDIAYITADNVMSDINTWDFNWTTSQFGNTNTTSAIGTNLTQTGPSLNSNISMVCDSITRNMWVTITRIAYNTPNTTEIAARQLNLGNVSDISLFFTSSVGEVPPVPPPVPIFASYLMTSVGMLVCLISIFAF